ncbi:MAG TPA: cell envelope protein, partial [Planctomycetaceae bacterium]|nr:cell envelope protein [Planctomycetaceae bacterium]
PADTAIQTPNSDTPYSMAGLDLRTEPLVISVPAIEKKRYYSIQMWDAYTYIAGYAGSRTTGNEAGNFLLVGPDWKGETPEGIKKVYKFDTHFGMVAFRTQLFNPADIDNVKKIQAQYNMQPLSTFLGTTPPQAAPVVDFIKPLTKEDEKTSLEFFSIMNFVLGYCPTLPNEKALRESFATIGIEGGKTFDPAKLSPEMRTAIEQGRADAWEAFAGGVKELNEGKLTSGDIFGSRETLSDNYLHRWLGTIGIYGNAQAEAMYPIYRVDSEGQPLTGSNDYTLHFAPGEYPPVNAFWSLTMYELPQSLLVANPINRYLINSPMLPKLKKDADGGLTIYIQNESPGKELEANWLPAPKGPFATYMRLYWPKEVALDGTWKAPKLEKVK